MKKRFFGIILAILCFAFLPNSAYADTVQSYTYHFDTTNVDSSFNPSQTYLYNSGSLINYQNPFQFTPKYVGFEYTFNSGFVANFYTQYCSAGIHNGSTNTNLFCLGPYNSDSGLVSLINTGSFYISAGNFGNINAGSNPFSAIAGGVAELDITFYSDSPSGSCSCDCPSPEPCPDCAESSKFIQVIIDAFWKFVAGFAGVISSLIAIFIVFRYIRKVF